MDSAAQPGQIQRVINGGKKYSRKKYASDATLSRILTMVRTYRGLPLCRKDFQDELGMGPDTIAFALAQLARAGKVAVKMDPDVNGRILYYDAEAWDKTIDPEINLPVSEPKQ